MTKKCTLLTSTYKYKWLRNKYLLIIHTYGASSQKWKRFALKNIVHINIRPHYNIKVCLVKLTVIIRGQNTRGHIFVLLKFHIFIAGNAYIILSIYYQNTDYNIVLYGLLKLVKLYLGIPTFIK